MWPLAGLRTEARSSSLAHQSELQRLPKVITHRPVLNHLSVLKPPDVDLLRGELLAGRRLAKELTEVAARLANAKWHTPESKRSSG
jgi:hypothetical protein